MQRAILSLLFVACFVPYLASLGLLPKSAAFLHEIFAGVILLYVLVVGIRSRFELVRAQYWIVFACMLVVMVCGVLLNPVEPGPVFAGMRNYFRMIPFFFIGAVYAFSEPQLRRQLAFLAVICVVQIPVAIHQRWVTLGRGGVTGDETGGTLIGSSTLSMFLIAAISLLVALQRRGYISFKAMLVLLLLFAFPTTINETKATFFMLPLVLLVTGVVLAKPGERVRNILVTLFVIVLFGAIFVPIYDHLIQNRQYGATIWEFITSENRAAGYLDRGVGVGAVGVGEAGRLEMITVPVSYLARDPFHLLFGFGIGSASESSLGVQFTGPYFSLFKPFLAMTFARVVLELGILGVALMLTLFWMIFRDSRIVAAREPGFLGAFAAGWTGVTAVIVIGFFYKDLTMIEPLTVPFWLYSGVIVAHRMRLELKHRQDGRTATFASTKRGRRARET